MPYDPVDPFKRPWWKSSSVWILLLLGIALIVIVELR